jgi:hypothetical protein
VLTVAALTGSGGRDEVSRQLAPLGTLEWHERASTLIARATAGGLDVVVTDLDDESGRSIAPTLVALAASRPTLPVIVYGAIDGATLRKLLAVAVTGLRMEYVVRPYEHLAPAVARVLSPAFRPGVVPLLLQRFVPRAPPPPRIFVALAALAAPTRPGVEEIARRTTISARTIERRLRRARWPAAHVVLQSFTALDVVWLMTEYGWSARLVQQVRAFPHASSLTRLLSNYAASRPATLREDGGFAAALEHVTGVLAPHPGR